MISHARRPPKVSALVLLLMLALLPGLGACMYGFSGGGGLPEHVQTVAIPPIQNETSQFALVDAFTTRLTDAMTGRLGAQLAAENQADAIVRAAITGYDDQALNFEAQEGQGAQVFQRRVTIRASVEIYDVARDRAIWSSQSVSGAGEYAPENETEEAGRRLALENLIQKIVNGAQSQW